MVPKHPTPAELKPFMAALKTGQATTESSAAFRKLLRFAQYRADTLYPPQQLPLFEGEPKPKLIMLPVQGKLF